MNVRKLLQQQAETTVYEGSVKSGRSEDTLALDHANIAYLRGDMREALAQLALIKDKTPEARLLEGWANYRLNQIHDARAAFQDVVNARPDLTDASAGLGFCALREGDLAAADTAFSGLLAKNPDDPSGLEGLAHVRHQQGRLAEARTLLERLLAKHPENGDARALLERLKSAP